MFKLYYDNLKNYKRNGTAIIEVGRMFMIFEKMYFMQKNCTMFQVD